MMIGVGDTLRQVAGKVPVAVVKDIVTRAVGISQITWSQDAGYEAEIHPMHDIFKLNKSESVLLVDTKDAFNSLNRQVPPLYLKYVCYH